MANLGSNFDATTVDPSSVFPVYPPAKYQVQIIKSDMMPTKDETGQFLLLEMEILDGEHAGGIIRDRLNLINKNNTAQEIAQRALSAICHATGVMQVSDSEQLHFKPFIAELRVKPAHVDKSGTPRDAQNEVKGYSAVGGGQPARPAQQATRPASTQTTAPASRPTAPASGNPPWRR